MKTVIVLLRGCIAEYERGIVADGDKLLRSALRLRTETMKAEKLARTHSDEPKAKTFEKM